MEWLNAVVQGVLLGGLYALFAAGLSASFKCMVYLFGPRDMRHEVDEYAHTHHADLGDVDQPAEKPAGN